jgi:hypothetical protein
MTATRQPMATKCCDLFHRKYYLYASFSVYHTLPLESRFYLESLSQGMNHGVNSFYGLKGQEAPNCDHLIYLPTKTDKGIKDPRNAVRNLFQRQFHGDPMIPQCGVNLSIPKGTSRMYPKYHKEFLSDSCYSTTRLQLNSVPRYQSLL